MFCIISVTRGKIIILSSSVWEIIGLTVYIWREDVELLAISAHIINSHSNLSLTANKYMPSFQINMFSFFSLRTVSRTAFNLERRVVISSRCLILVDIDSFIRRDRDIINRRLGERRKVSLCFSLSSGLERIPKSLSYESGLPNSFGFIKDL